MRRWPRAWFSCVALAARAHRHAGQRDRLRGRRRRRASDGSASSSSRSSACRCSPARSRSSSSSASGCCPPHAAARSRRLQRARADAHRPVRASTSDAVLAADPRVGRRGGRDPAALELIGETVFPGWSPTSGDLVVLAVQRKGEELGPGRSSSRPATRCCCRARGARWTSNSTTRTCSSSTRRTLVRRQAVPLGAGREARRSPCWRRWSSCSRPGAVPAAVAGLLAAGAIVAAPRAHRRAGIPRDLVDDRDPRRRDDPALDRDGADRRRGRRSPTRLVVGRRRRGRATRCCSASSC